jgi:hypothetical protein
MLFAIVPCANQQRAIFGNPDNNSIAAIAKKTFSNSDTGVHLLCLK